MSFREIDNEIDDFYNTIDDGNLVENFYIQNTYAQVYGDMVHF